MQGASGKPPACSDRQQLCRNQFPVGGIDAPTLARVVGLPPRGGSTFFRSERKYQRKPAARRLQRRPTSLRTAAKPCATLVLGYALHGLRPFLALVGLRPSLVVGFGLREPNGWMPRIYSGHPIPALRPEQSDHVPWAGCPQGLSSTSARCAHPPGKSPLLPIFERGSSQCRAQHSWLTNSYVRARSCSLFSSFKKGKAFSLRCLSPLCSPAVGVGQTYPLRGDVVSTTGLLCRFNERRLMIPHSRRGAYAALAGILLPSQ